MSNCPLCNIKKELVVFEDQDIVAFLSNTPASLSHVIVTTKKHFPTIAETPDEIVAWSFAVANKISKALMESINLQGLNLLLNVGSQQNYPHFSINILPRFKNDNLNLKWKPEKADPDDLKTVQLFLLEQDKQKIEESPKKTEKINKEDYRVKQLFRLP